MAASEILHIRDKRKASRARASLQGRGNGNHGAGKKRSGLSRPVKKLRNGQERGHSANRVFASLWIFSPSMGERRPGAMPSCRLTMPR